MSYWCITCKTYKANQDPCIGLHEVCPTPEDDIALVREGRDNLKKTVHEIHGILDAVLHAVDTEKAVRGWVPIAIRECRKALGLPVEPIPPLSIEEKEMLRKIGFRIEEPS